MVKGLSDIEDMSVGGAPVDGLVEIFENHGKRFCKGEQHFDGELRNNIQAAC